MKRCFNSTVVREIKIKITVRYHFISKLQKFKTLTEVIVGEVVGQQELTIASESVHWFSGK